jgi:hypothetical protein
MTTKPTSTITTSKYDTQPIVILREFEQGILIKVELKGIIYIPWTEIKEIKTSGTHVKFKGFICSNFHKACITEQ